MESLNYLDVILAAIVLISALVGIVRGFLREVLSLFAWVFAIWAAFRFSGQLSAYLLEKGFLDDAQIAYFGAFGVVFLCALFLVGMLNLLFSSFFKATGLGGIDRSLGMGFGLIRGLILGALLIFCTRLIPDFDNGKTWQGSKLKGIFVHIADWGVRKIPEQVKKQLDDWVDDGSEKLPSASNTLQSIAQYGGDTLRLSSIESNTDKEELTPTVLRLESLPSSEEMPEAPILQLESIREGQ